MTVKLYPLPSLFDEDVATVKAATPVNASSFYLKRPLSVPWSVLPTSFVLETDRPELPHTFTLNRTEKFTLVPGSSIISMQIQLKQGANRIDIESPVYTDRGLWSATHPYNRFDTVVYDGSLWLALTTNLNVTPTEGAYWTQDTTVIGEYEATYFTVAATGVEAWLRALGREHYLSVSRRLREINNQFTTPWTTRLSAHFLPYTDLFLPARMPKVQQTRLAIVASTGQRLGHGDGIISLAAAMSYSTPWVSRSRNSEFMLPGRDPDYPAVTTHPTTGEDKGRLLDIWSPNQCLASKQALIQLALAVGSNDCPEPKPLRLIDFDDYQVLLQMGDGGTEVHYLNPLSPQCSEIEFNTDCHGSIRVYATIDGVMNVMMNTPQLPLDEVVESPLNFGFWDEGNETDMSMGSGAPGLGGGDDTFDTVDPDDPFGAGFLGVSLSRRLDAACLDSRLQRGVRLVKYTVPLNGTTGLTPDPDSYQAGSKLVVDTASTGAPPATTGTTTIWATSNRNFLYEGDLIRVETPDSERSIVSAWPVFEASTLIAKTGSGTVALTGTQREVSAASGFFEQKHEGLGLQVTIGMAITYASIVRVSDNGITSVALLAGNPAIGTGAATLDVYYPKRDRLVTQGAPFAGHRVYEIELSSGLANGLVDQQALDIRCGILSVGVFAMGSSIVRLATDLIPLPGDRLYFSSSTYRHIEMVTDTGLTHHTTGFKVYDILMDATSPSGLVDNQALFSISADPCWENGDPVTPLLLISMAPAAHLEP